MIWAIDHLAEQGAVKPQRDWAPLAEPVRARNAAALEALPAVRSSFLAGDAGLALVGHRLTRGGVWIERAVEAARANLSHASNELMLGAPGTLLAAHALLDETRDERLREVVATSAERVLSELRFEPDYGCKLWTQEFGGRTKMLGLVHGFAGNALALCRAGHAAALESEVERTLDATAQIEDGLANWPQSVGPPRPGRTAPLVQICHGAPGVIVALARLEPRPGSRTEELLRMGGELTWRAGPLAKGSGLCHGTAGNGYAFLCLYRRTGERAWLERARAFAMHAIGQWEEEQQRVRPRPLLALDRRPRPGLLPVGLRARARRLPDAPRVLSERGYTRGMKRFIQPNELARDRRFKRAELAEPARAVAARRRRADRGACSR